jgi:hypothetical protein
MDKTLNIKMADQYSIDLWFWHSYSQRLWTFPLETVFCFSVILEDRSQHQSLSPPPKQSCQKVWANLCSPLLLTYFGRDFLIVHLCYLLQSGVISYHLSHFFHIRVNSWSFWMDGCIFHCLDCYAFIHR